MTIIEPSGAETLRQLLFLLHTLDPIRGPRAQSSTSGSDTKLDQTSIRRSFVEAIAYVCACKRGRHVVAAALQQKSTGITLWLAGNEAISRKVKRFINLSLDKLRETVLALDHYRDVDQAELLSANKLLPEILAFQKPRIQVYYKQIKNNYLNPCLKIIQSAIDRESSENFNTSHLSALREWLKERFPDGECHVPEGTQLGTLVQDCYNLRDLGHADTLRGLSQQGHGGCQVFQMLYKLLGKLGKNIAVAKAFVRGPIRLRELADQFQIDFVPLQSVLKASNLSLETILKHHFSSELDRTRYLNRLKFLSGNDDIPHILMEKDDAKKIVHAELLLLDYFYKNNYQFAGGDNYIGCSKPACYLCHAYIKNHPGQFAVPPCHNTIYLGWRAPDIDQQNPESLATTEMVIENLTMKAREDLDAEMNSTEPRRPYHPNSPAATLLEPFPVM